MLAKEDKGLGLFLTIPQEIGQKIGAYVNEPNVRNSIVQSSAQLGLKLLVTIKKDTCWLDYWNL